MYGTSFRSGYLALHRSGELKRRGEALWEMLWNCRLCPRQCGVDRLRGETGYCKAPASLKVASFHAHFGEEPPLVGAGGSGTIFLSHCNLGCAYCQNWDISHGGEGVETNPEGLADMMLRLQEQMVQNINIVTPTHYSPFVVKALDMAADRGLRLPLVYNTSGWERPEILQLLDGVVDVYLADYKYSDPVRADRYSPGASTYPAVTQKALMEMNRQVGVATPASNGIIHRGLMIRHLVLPTDAGGSRRAMHWIAENLPADTYVNIMSQYRPAYMARKHPEIDRPVGSEEYRVVVETARSLGLVNLETDL